MNREDWIAPLSRTECLELLASVPIGRVVFTEMAMPAAFPVNFIALPDGIVFRTRGGGALELGVRNAVVGFEADAYDADGTNGWSVLVVGTVDQTTEVSLPALMRFSEPWPWTSGDRDRLFKITYGRVTGRRVGELPQAAPA